MAETSHVGVKRLILLRHAHRDKFASETDNGLSSRGRKQAKDTAKFLANQWKKEWQKAPLEIYSSPKVRCIETAQALADAVDGTVLEDELLDEAGPRESPTVFMDRIRAFLNRWKRSTMAVTVACSHGDWLPEAIRMLVDVESDFRKGAFVEINEISKGGEKFYELTDQRDPEE